MVPPIEITNLTTGDVLTFNPDENASPLGNWKLHSIEGNQDEKMGRVSLILEVEGEDKIIRGNDACNSYSGTIRNMDKKKINFGSFSKTERACMIPAEHADLLYENLDKVQSYLADQSNLILRDVKGNNLLHFVKSE